jgi:hypothetical protein
MLMLQKPVYLGNTNLGPRYKNMTLYLDLIIIMQTLKTRENSPPNKLEPNLK